MTDSSQKKIIVLTAPSGAGKTSITHHLLKKFPDKLEFSISAATREPRSFEKNGVDYYFIPLEEFLLKIQRNEFVEWEMVYEGKYYGTLKSELVRIWNNNRVPVLDIDVKGAIHIQRQFPESVFSIFVEPPSVKELEKRLRSRGTETEASLLARINKATYELSFSHQFNKVIINEQLDEACREAETAILEYLHQV
jgi:guanylate kinase